MNDINDEIDFTELLKTFYLERKFIFKCSIFSIIVGVVYSLAQPETFTSSTTFIPQLSSGVKASGSSLSGLASLAGINIGSVESSSEFPPSLYPQVVNGIPFKLDLLSSNIKVKDLDISVKDYLSNKSSFKFYGFLKKYTIGLPSVILSFFKKKNESVPRSNSKIFVVTQKDKNLFNVLSSELSLSINEKEGFISIAFTDTNKNVAAQITQIAQNLLQEKIIEFKNKASKETLEFAVKQYDEIKEAHEILQDERAIFVDKNINISSSLFQNKLSRIESELNISESILLQLANQAEQARLQVNKNTPVFTTIEPVTIPFQRSAPKRTLTVIIFLFVGFTLSCAYVLIKEPVITIIKSIKS